jgi:lipid A 3-O-deacylase
VGVPTIGRSLWVRWVSVALVGALAAPAPRVAAQAVDEIRLEEENGQLDFWLPAPRRPDTELANAVALSLAANGAPLWGGLVRLPACGTVTPERRCATTEWQLGQEIFTPMNATKTAAPRPGARPYAGWLYLSTMARVATAVQSDALTIETGVTGPPSLAEKVQTDWHGLIGYPRPLGWSHQIPFQAGLLMSAEHRQELVSAAVAGTTVLSIVPQAAVTVGNVLTGAQIGVDARIGYGITTPWSSAVRGRGRKVQIYAVGAVREELVIHELFLDEGTSRPALHVEKEPWVTQYELGVGAQLGPVEAQYRGVTRGREYTTGPASHAYGTLLVGLRPGW